MKNRVYNICHIMRSVSDHSPFRLAPPLLVGNLRIGLVPWGADDDAEPIVNSVAAEDAGGGAPNGNDGWCPNPPSGLLNPAGVAGCGRLKFVFPPAGEAGWLEPNANVFVVVGSSAVNENGDG